ncbi:unnamed protein product [Paramecium sonneborni]|uniref:Uncharacterized protein n=1 Tax=Paramecium sonneborni TaxID=65129 RepID=A0A8S1Q1L1_9CILI|nr:unnamed protein product [Paramecium sonneborni]
MEEKSIRIKIETPQSESEEQPKIIELIQKDQEKKFRLNRKRNDEKKNIRYSIQKYQLNLIIKNQLQFKRLLYQLFVKKESYDNCTQKIWQNLCSYIIYIKQFIKSQGKRTKMFSTQYCIRISSSILQRIS